MFRFKVTCLVSTLLLCAVAGLAAEEAVDRCYYSTEAAGSWVSAARAQQATPRYGRGTPFDIRHIKLEVALDFKTETLRGTATTTLAAVGEPRDEIVMDSVGLDVAEAVTGDGTELEFECCSHSSRTIRLLSAESSLSESSRNSTATMWSKRSGRP